MTAHEGHESSADDVCRRGVPITIASTTEYPLRGASLRDVSLSSAVFVFVAM